MTSGIATVSAGGQITALNHSFVNTLGFNFESNLQGRSIYDEKSLLDSGFVEKILRCLKRKEAANYENPYRGPDNLEKYIEYTLTPIQMDDHGFEVEVLFTVNDITLERKEKERLTAEAMLDGLTGLYKQDKLISEVENRINEAKEYRYLLGMVHIDVDNFSKVNSKFGHQAASEVLGLVGHRIRSSINQDRDVGFRTGGDEFAVIFAQFPSGALEIIVSRLFNRLSELYSVSVDGRQEDIKCTFSVGVTEYSPDKDQSAEKLYKESDDATYEAKRNGKNRVVFYGSESHGRE